MWSRVEAVAPGGTGADRAAPWSIWGARTANVIAALWPNCTAMVSVSGYVIGSQEVNKTPLPPAAEFNDGPG
jgi:hypothetical protein